MQNKIDWEFVILIGMMFLFVAVIAAIVTIFDLLKS